MPSDFGNIPFIGIRSDMQHSLVMEIVRHLMQ